MPNTPPLHRKYAGVAVREGSYAQEHACIVINYALAATVPDIMRIFTGSAEHKIVLAAGILRPFQNMVFVV